MFAKMALPLLGGSPAVWNTAVVFYQAALLCGYLYAHTASTRLGVRRQAMLHIGLLLLPLFVLPIAIPHGWTPPTDANPIPWFLIMLTIAVGLPFLVVSTSSPLLQIWFAHTNDRAAKDPYFLYAASNAGSMFALLAYPFLLEPTFRLAEQSWLWAVGYGLFAVLTVTCAIGLWRTMPSKTNDSSIAPNSVAEHSNVPISIHATQPTKRRRLYWVLLAFVPSSLMLSVTTYLSTDIAPFPLLWVIPLAIYLLSFILVFAQRTFISQRWLIRFFPVVLTTLIICIALQISQPFWFASLVHLLTLFVVAMLCHGQLAQDRPSTQHLTEFYVWMSVGGVLGGMFNALLAPLLFNAVIEYPLGIVLACFLLPASSFRRRQQRSRWIDLVIPILFAVALAGGRIVLNGAGLTYSPIGALMLLVLPMMVCAAFIQRPLRFGLMVGIVFLIGTSAFQSNYWQMLVAERSFFGINRVMTDGRSHALFHGGILHGLQRLEPTRRRDLVTYYHPTGPIGQVFEEVRTHRPLKHVGVVGLGTGNLACYKEPGEAWDFYEIDPAVANIARDARYFTFLEECTPDARIVLGDARVSLADVPPQHYDLLILDAYSGDSIPVHLVTREAINLYLDGLSPQGLLVFHVTNRYLDLEPVLGGLAKDADLVGLIRRDSAAGNEMDDTGKVSSDWVVLARDTKALGSLMDDARWQPLHVNDQSAIWTDDYSSILDTLKWR